MGTASERYPQLTFLRSVRCGAHVAHYFSFLALPLNVGKASTEQSVLREGFQSNLCYRKASKEQSLKREGSQKFVTARVTAAAAAPGRKQVVFGFHAGLRRHLCCLRCIRYAVNSSFSSSILDALVSPRHQFVQVISVGSINRHCRSLLRAVRVTHSVWVI